MIDHRARIRSVKTGSGNDRLSTGSITDRRNLQLTNELGPGFPFDIMEVPVSKIELHDKHILELIHLDLTNRRALQLERRSEKSRIHSLLFKGLQIHHSTKAGCLVLEVDHDFPVVMMDVVKVVGISKGHVQGKIVVEGALVGVGSGGAESIERGMRYV